VQPKKSFGEFANITTAAMREKQKAAFCRSRSDGVPPRGTTLGSTNRGDRTMLQATIAASSGEAHEMRVKAQESTRQL
jgi:hypothetical protein